MSVMRALDPADDISWNESPARQAALEGLPGLCEENVSEEKGPVGGMWGAPDRNRQQPAGKGLLETARLSTGRGQNQRLAGQARSVKTAGPEGFQLQSRVWRRESEGGTERGLPAGGGVAKEEKACPSAPNTHVYNHTHTHTLMHRFTLRSTPSYTYSRLFTTYPRTHTH